MKKYEKICSYRSTATDIKKKASFEQSFCFLKSSIVDLPTLELDSLILFECLTKRLMSFYFTHENFELSNIQRLMDLSKKINSYFATTASLRQGFPRRSFFVYPDTSSGSVRMSFDRLRMYPSN